MGSGREIALPGNGGNGGPAAADCRRPLVVDSDLVRRTPRARSEGRYRYGWR
jgi:hypothetical protein